MNNSLLIGAVSTIALSACANMGPNVGPNMGVEGGGLAAGGVLDQICGTAQVTCIDVVIQVGVITQIRDEDFTGPNHLILWKLKPLTAPYTFPEKGIDFKGTSPRRPDNEFNCRPVAQGRLFVCSNRNTVAGTYTYNVTLKPDAGGNPITFDPKIVNN